MLSDWFPKERRATALAVYSAGLYLGGGISLLIGAVVVKAWNAHYPGGGPLGLVGWQAAFLAVGLPGMLLSAWVATLKEPIRGRAEGLPEPPRVENVGAKLWQDISSVIPPFTFFHLAPFGARVFSTNIGVALAFAALAALLIRVTGDVPQWLAMCLGGYAVTSWAQSLKQRDAADLQPDLGDADLPVRARRLSAASRSSAMPRHSGRCPMRCAPSSRRWLLPAARCPGMPAQQRWR